MDGKHIARRGAALLAATAAGFLLLGETARAGESFTEGVKEGAVEVGKGAKELGQDVGRAAKEAGVAVGKTAKEAGTEVGKAFRETGKAIRDNVTEGK